MVPGSSTASSPLPVRAPEQWKHCQDGSGSAKVVAPLVPDSSVLGTWKPHLPGQVPRPQKLGHLPGPGPLPADSRAVAHPVGGGDAPVLPPSLGGVCSSPRGPGPGPGQRKAGVSVLCVWQQGSTSTTEVAASPGLSSEARPQPPYSADPERDPGSEAERLSCQC